MIPETIEVKEETYSDAELARINPLCLPKHVAIIMDGNRRWAKREKLPPMAGHWKGAETLSAIVRAAGELGIEVLTVYAFSTENWKRPPVEVKSLMRLFKTHLLRQRDVMIGAGVRLNVIGDLAKFPADVRQTLDETIAATAKGKKMDLVIALNYGGRDEIKRAVRKIVDDCIGRKLSKKAISEKTIASYLDTGRWKDPDLLIRPSGEARVSNFLLWQISYSEIVLTDVFWPDFSHLDLLEAVCEYQSRELRIGK